MPLPFDKTPDKVFGWFVLAALLMSWLAIVPVMLSSDSRIVFGIIVLAWACCLLLLAMRLLRRGDKLLGWGMMASFAVFAVSWLFTSRAMPLLYVTVIFVGWGTWRLLRHSPEKELATQPASEQGM